MWRFSKTTPRRYRQRPLLLLGCLILISTAVRSQPVQQGGPAVDPRHFGADSSPCYDNKGQPQRCVPAFINAAFNLEVEVTNTCGQQRPTKYCVQSSHSGVHSVCNYCDDRDPRLRHPAQYLTDFNNANNETWWQSDTMLEGMQFPNSVNLTLHLGKTFDITYVRLKFISSRPESFAIYKKTMPDSEQWELWQAYSGSCRSTFGMQERAPILPGNEAMAQCTKEFSDISPITGGDVAMSTLENRPSAHAFEDSPVLQQWVTASSILIVLRRLNTFGDELYGDSNVLSSYFYAISDFAVGGRCKCNGHASECVKSTGEGDERLVCRCEHNTEGPDCDQCKPFFNDRPWKPATASEANECRACNCSGLAARCYFDEELFERTGSGGHCIDCQGNTHGVHCEQCAPDHWRRPGERVCAACNCNSTGSLSTQCDEFGQCQCRPGVGGARCDQCLPTHFGFSSTGCQECSCSVPGSLNNDPLCHPATGECACKTNVEGKQCKKCKPGFFDLSLHNEFGCHPCFCFGRSSVCQSADGYYASNVSASFESNKQHWLSWSQRTGLGDAQWAEQDQTVAVSDQDGLPVYFVASSDFHGDQRASYNQDLQFELRVQHPHATASIKDIVLTGASGDEISLAINAQENPLPTALAHAYRFRLHADDKFGWYPRKSEMEFIGLLSNVTSIKIRGSYSPRDIGYLSWVALGSASRTAPPSESEQPKVANWIEQCDCTSGYLGQFCETCSDGYRREVKFGGPFARCVKCDCHGHSESCNVESGECFCQHHTAGETCERCERGYYGNALAGTPEDCVPCPCPNGGPCILHSDNDVICTDCPTGYTGRRCDECSDGYFGNPKEGSDCQECNCSGNIDPNSIGNCDRVTGECRKCIYNTAGEHCETCRAGFWGSALADPKGDCKACRCYPPGTLRPSADYTQLACRQDDGQCHCQPHVIGLQCDQCERGFFNLSSGVGCEQCDCSPIGSVDSTCDQQTGQCHCKPGVTGRKCDECMPQHWGFSAEGCQSCDCEPAGSQSPQCDVVSGQCLCRERVDGRRCDQCIENHYDLGGGCRQCDQCYSLIYGRVKEFRSTVKKLNETLQEIIDNPAPVNDTTFESKVQSVGIKIATLSDDVARQLESGDSAMANDVARMKTDITEALKRIADIDELLKEAKSIGEETSTQLNRWSLVRDRADEELERALKFLETEGRTQLDIAREAAKKYGRQSEQLSNFANTSRREADKHEEKAQLVEKLAEQSTEAAKRALDQAEQAVYGSNQLSQEISTMAKDVDSTNTTLIQTLQLSLEQNAAADAAHRAAALSLTAVEALKLPDVKPNELAARASKTTESAKSAREKLKESVEKHEETMQAAQRATAQATYELQRVQDQQKVADELLASVEKSRGQATAAVKLAEDTLNEAQRTLDTLNDFNGAVERSKEEALAELAKLAEIAERVESARTKTSETKERMGSAREQTENTQKEVETAQKEADELRRRSADTRQRTKETDASADRLVAELDTLHRDLTDAERVLADYTQQTNQDKEATEQAVRRAALAESAALNASNLAHALWTEVKGLVDQLHAVRAVPLADLNNLQTQLELAEKALEDAQLDDKIPRERAQWMSEERRLAAARAQLDSLSRELRTLEQIRDELPAKCFNVVSLEQEGQK